MALRRLGSLVPDAGVLSVYGNIQFYEKNQNHPCMYNTIYLLFLFFAPR